MIEYIDRDGEVWRHGPDRNGDIGYHVDEGLAFPTAENAERWPGRMTFEEAIDYFGMVPVDAVTPAYEAFQRLRAPEYVPGNGDKVIVDERDLAVILIGWEQWYRDRVDKRSSEE